MKRILFLLLGLALCASVHSANIRDMVVRDTADVLSIPVTTNTMLDLYDYYDAGRDVWVRSINDGPVGIDTIAPSYMSMKLGTVRNLALALKTIGRDTVIVACETLKSPIEIGRVKVYTVDFKDVTDKYFQPLSVKDFISVPKGSEKTADEVLEKIDMTLINYKLLPETGDITATLNIKDYFVKSDYEKLKSYIRDNRIYRWTGKKYKLQK